MTQVKKYMIKNKLRLIYKKKQHSPQTIRFFKDDYGSYANPDYVDINEGEFEHNYFKHYLEQQDLNQTD